MGLALEERSRVLQTSYVPRIKERKVEKGTTKVYIDTKERRKRREKGTWIMNERKGAAASRKKPLDHDA
jgi:hypothetical protein